MECLAGRYFHNTLVNQKNKTLELSGDVLSTSKPNLREKKEFQIREFVTYLTGTSHVLENRRIRNGRS